MQSSHHSVLTYGSSSSSALEIPPGSWVGFDLDHALVRYRVPALMRLVHDCLAPALVSEQPCLAAGGAALAAALRDCYDPRFVHKGLLLDFRSGDVLKLDDGCRVVAGRHGRTPLDAATLRERYGSEPWWGSDVLRAQGRHDDLFVLLTYFDMPCVCLASELVHWVDAGVVTLPQAAAGEPGGGETPPPARYGALRSMLLSTFDFVFDNVKSFDSGRGGFFAAVRASPAEYLCKRPRLRSWLLSSRAAGRRVFLATNSAQRYAELLLHTSLGEDWRACFDLVMYSCGKPSFFTRPQRFHEADEATGAEGPPVTVVALAPRAAGAPPPPAVCFVFGSAAGVQALANAEQGLVPGAEELRLELDDTGRVLRVLVSGEPAAASADATPRARVLYCGDHLHGDIVAAVQSFGWDAIAVVEELEESAPLAHVARAASCARLSLPMRDWHAERNHGDGSVWGDFFAAGDEGGRSYFCALLQQFARVTVTDVEAWLAHAHEDPES